MITNVLSRCVILVPRADKLDFSRQTAKGAKGQCSMTPDHERIYVAMLFSCTLFFYHKDPYS